MLNDNDKYHKPDGLFWFYQQQNQCTRNSTNNRADNRDHVGQTDDNADEYWILEVENGHANKTEQAQNAGIHQLTADKVGEDFKRDIAIMGNSAVIFLGECLL